MQEVRLGTDLQALDWEPAALPRWPCLPWLLAACWHMRARPWKPFGNVYRCTEYQRTLRSGTARGVRVKIHRGSNEDCNRRDITLQTTSTLKLPITSSMCSPACHCCSGPLLSLLQWASPAGKELDLFHPQNMKNLCYTTCLRACRDIPNYGADTYKYFSGQENISYHKHVLRLDYKNQLCPGVVSIHFLILCSVSDKSLFNDSMA